MPRKLSAIWPYRVGDGPVDLEVAEHPLDAVALAIELLAVSGRRYSVGFQRDDGFDPALLQVRPDCVGVT